MTPTTAADINARSFGSKINSLKLFGGEEKRKMSYFASDADARSKLIKTIKIPMNKIKSDCNSTINNVSLDGGNSVKNVRSLKKFMIKELSKADKEILSLQKGFENLVDCYRDAIVRKYKKIA